MYSLQGLASMPVNEQVHKEVKISVQVSNFFAEKEAFSVLHESHYAFFQQLHLLFLLSLH